MVYTFLASAEQEEAGHIRNRILGAQFVRMLAEIKFAVRQESISFLIEQFCFPNVLCLIRIITSSS